MVPEARERGGDLLLVRRLRGRPGHARESIAAYDRDMGMQPDEIFQLIITADERLKYATDQRAASRREQAKALLQQALEAAQEIGNAPLAEQAQRRLSDLESLEGGRGAG
jgi:hypothetical protein